jgi:hypothetical protein
MSTSAVAILTYRRRHVLEKFMKSLETSIRSDVPVAIFEDCANSDSTTEFLMDGSTFVGVDEELDALEWRHEGGARPFTAYIGRRNQGVAGNSNRAVRWFERKPEYDHLCLCNDDLVASDNFIAEYKKAHDMLNIGLFCFCPVKLGEEYVGPVIPVLGNRIRMVPRMTGAMMSMTRKLVEKIGYFDPTFGKFGNEHCDMSNRAMLAGFSLLKGQQQQCLDVESKFLDYQYGEKSSITPEENVWMDAVGQTAMGVAAQRYGLESWYRPYRLGHGNLTGGHGGMGIPCRLMERVGYPLVVSHELYDTGGSP